MASHCPTGPRRPSTEYFEVSASVPDDPEIQRYDFVFYQLKNISQQIILSGGLKVMTQGRENTQSDQYKHVPCQQIRFDQKYCRTQKLHRSEVDYTESALLLIGLGATKKTVAMCKANAH